MNINTLMINEASTDPLPINAGQGFGEKIPAQSIDQKSDQRK
jgi:hypothetical protein